MDNFRIDITAEGEAALRGALAVVFSHHRQADYFAVRPADPKKGLQGPRLVLFWGATQAPGDAPDAKPLAFPLTAKNAHAFVSEWLSTVTPSHGEPDHDGSNGKGFRVWNDDWTHVEGSFYGVCAVAPEWAWYGK